MKTSIAVAIVVAVLLLVGPATSREWTDSTGRYKVEAEFVALVDGIARLNRRNGKTVDVPLARLSHADRTWIEAKLNARAKSAGKSAPIKAIQGDFTTAIIATAGPASAKRVCVLPGSNLWVEVAETQSGMALRDIMLLKPGSLLFVAEGGVPRNSLPDSGKAETTAGLGTADLTLKYVSVGFNGAKSALGLARFKNTIPLQAARKPAQHAALDAGRVYEVTDSGRIQPSTQHAVFVRFPREQVLRNSPRSDGTRIGTVEPDTDAELLRGASEITGWHKVRTLHNPPAEGWVLGPWGSVKFTKTSSGNSGDFRAAATKSHGSGLQFHSRITASLRGWTLAGKHWLAVSVPLSALPKSFTLRQCELRRDDSTVAKAIGVIPPSDAGGSIAGTLAITRNNSPIRVGSHELRPAKELEDPSEGTMRMSVAREVSFEELSLYEFGVDSILVVGSSPRLRVDGNSLSITPTSEMGILSEYGWKVAIAPSGSRAGIQFTSKADATIAILFAIGPEGVHGVALSIDAKPAGTVVIAK